MTAEALAFATVAFPRGLKKEVIGFDLVVASNFRLVDMIPIELV